MSNERLYRVCNKILSLLTSSNKNRAFQESNSIKDKWRDSEMPTYLYKKPSYLVKLGLPDSKEFFCILVPDFYHKGFGELEIFFEVPDYHELKPIADQNFSKKNSNDISGFTKLITNVDEFSFSNTHEINTHKITIKRIPRLSKAYLPEIPFRDFPDSAEIFTSAFSESFSEHQLNIFPVNQYSALIGN